MVKKHLIIATRESPLALWQAETVKAYLLSLYADLHVDLLGMTTQADKRLDVDLIEIGGKGLFVKELEEALLDGRADMAVHSMKDVPMVLPPGLCLPVIGRREDPRDAFVSNQYANIATLPPGAVVGTSSLRRQTQLLAHRPDLHVRSLRGNVQTRIKKLDAGEYDAIILAAAGLERLQLQHRIRDFLTVEAFLPSAGQGALGIECREGDEDLHALIAAFDDPATQVCVSAERALCRRLGGGCKVPVAAFAEIVGGAVNLRGLVANRTGSLILRAEQVGEAAKAQALGTRVAEQLLQQGAADILREFHV